MGCMVKSVAELKLYPNMLSPDDAFTTNHTQQVSAKTFLGLFFLRGIYGEGFFFLARYAASGNSSVVGYARYLL